MTEEQDVLTQLRTIQPKKPNERARELYKYFNSATLRRETEYGVIRPDTILISQAQLVCWKLDVRRCLINFLDSNTQYCIADGTKSLHLENLDVCDDPADCLGSQYAPSDAEHSICQHTMNVQPPTADDALDGCFEVLNLRKDARFVAVPEKAGSPNMTYYCGTPLRTRKGVSIGALCVFDDKQRGPISKDELRFLQVIAQNIISHLELLRDKAERKRANKMSRCLNMLVDPEFQVHQRRGRAPEYYSGTGPHSSTTNASSRMSPMMQGQSPGSDTVLANPPSMALRQSSESKDSSPSSPGYQYNQARPSAEGSEASHGSRIQEADHVNTYKYGAEVLRQALDLEGGGGTVFLDTTPILNVARPDSESGDEDEPRDRRQPTNHVRRASGDDSVDAAAAEARPAEILASSIKDATTPPALSIKALASIRKRYPRGKLWVFDSEGNACESDEDKDAQNPTISSTAASNEAQLLRRHFPGARQVIGLPLLDARTSRWTFCFAWSTSKWRTMTYETDFLFTIAFCNCIAMEKSRLATLAADQQKSDFIGSISHELRSPLHGILGSCEFLQDTEMSHFQQSLVDTVDSCARTLLDTISMVLDYSKINTFDRDQRGAGADRHNSISLTNNGSLLTELGAGQTQQGLNIYGNVDIALLVEQVVEGVQSGHIFRDTSTLQFSGISSGNGADSTQSAVEIILDIDPGDWCFLTQPGAFRRIVMNIVGNALKYTSRGSITIKLEKLSGDGAGVTAKPTTRALGHKADTSIVRFTVTDTGRGISPEYLRNKLFEPFSQENTLAPGTGLGLSLVKSILKVLRGFIDVRSTVNVGTKVTVTLPMVKTAAPMPGTTAATGSTLPPTVPMLEHEAFASLAQANPHFTLGIFAQSGGTNGTSSTVRALLDSVKTYMSHWYGLRNVVSWAKGTKMDLVLADESDLDALIDAFQGEPRPFVMILCSNVSRHAQWNKHAREGNNLDFISKPFGPYKLAKALRAHLEQQSSRRSSQTTATGAQDYIISNQPAELADDPRHRASSIELLASPTTPFTDTPLEPSQVTRPTLTSRRTISTTNQEMVAMAVETSATTTTMTLAGAAVDPRPIDEARREHKPPPLVSSKPQPRLLLVDDNNINLRLLETYARKRKYTNVVTAMNGLEAVEAFESGISKCCAPDIIFMDLSMPVMGGLEATRKIREIENIESAGELVDAADEDVAPDCSPPVVGPRRTMVVALTGLASAKDQVEAFSSGVDVYMTKPLSFKELGKLLDNWEKAAINRLEMVDGPQDRDHIGTYGGNDTTTGTAEAA